VQLSVPDVERDDLRRASLEEAVGEPARRRARIERPATSDGDDETLEGGIELLTSPADEA